MFVFFFWMFMALIASPTYNEFLKKKRSKQTYFRKWLGEKWRPIWAEGLEL